MPRQDAQYLESIGLQRDAVANVEQIRGLVLELNTANAKIAAQAEQIERLKEELERARETIIDAQGEWSCVAMTYAPEDTHALKQEEANIDALLAELAK